MIVLLTHAGVVRDHPGHQDACCARCRSANRAVCGSVRSHRGLRVGALLSPCISTMSHPMRRSTPVCCVLSCRTSPCVVTIWSVKEYLRPVARTCIATWLSRSCWIGAAVLLHRQARRGVHSPDASLLQGDDLVGMIVGAVELQVRGGTSRAADRLPVHPAHEAAEGLGGWAVPEDVVSLVVQGQTADLDQAGSVSTAVEAQVPQPRRIDDGRWGRTLLSVCLEAPHGRMIGKVHEDTATGRLPAPPATSSWDANSPIMMLGALVLAEGIVGMTEASAIRRPSTPRTRSSASTTASSPDPIAQVPTGWR